MVTSESPAQAEASSSVIVLEGKPLTADPESLSSSRSPTPIASHPPVTSASEPSSSFPPSPPRPSPVPLTNKHIQLDLPPPPPSPTFNTSASFASSSHPSPASSLRPSKSQSSQKETSKKSRKRSKSNATTSSGTSVSRPAARYPALPPQSPVGTEGAHKNFDALFSLDRQVTKDGIIGEQAGTTSGSKGVTEKAVMLEKLKEQERVNGEKAAQMGAEAGPLDAYLPQSGPNAFSTQAYEPSPGMVFDPSSAADIAKKEENSRIAGKTGVGWLGCIVGVCLFSCTDCCCCC